MDEDGRLALRQVLCQEEPRRVRRQAHLRDSRLEPLDREHHLATEHIAVEGEVPGDVGAREIDEVEGLERNGLLGPAHG